LIGIMRPTYRGRARQVNEMLVAENSVGVVELSS
jgi:hypothetical protein